MSKLIKILFSITDVVSTFLCGFLVIGSIVTPFALTAQAKMEGIELELYKSVVGVLMLLSYSLSFYLISKRKVQGFIILVALAICQSILTVTLLPIYILGTTSLLLFVPFGLTRKLAEISP